MHDSVDNRRAQPPVFCAKKGVEPPFHSRPQGTPVHGLPEAGQMSRIHGRIDSINVLIRLLKVMSFFRMSSTLRMEWMTVE